MIHISRSISMIICETVLGSAPPAIQNQEVTFSYWRKFLCACVLRIFKRSTFGTGFCTSGVSYHWAGCTERSNLSVFEIQPQ